MHAVVLAAGEGKRMRPLTSDRPKVMLPVAGRPLLVHVLEQAAAGGVTDAHLVVHYHREGVERVIGDGSAFGLRVTYHEQGEPRGTGHALAAVAVRPDAPFLVLSGDTLVDAGDLKALIATSRKSGLGAMGAARVSDPTRFGALETDGGRLVRIHEKSSEPPSDLINAGTYVLPPAIFPHLDALTPSPRGELELTDAVEALAREAGVTVHELATWRDCGRPWDLLNLNEALLAAIPNDSPYWTIDGTVESGVHLHGPVRVEPGAVVKSGTYIEGPVVVQGDARVGPMAYIRGSTVIGPRCHVGAHTETKNTILMEDANIPHLNYVGDSVIGSHVNLGAGTKVANLRHDKKDIAVHVGADEKLSSGRRKMGVIIGHGVKTGINVTLDCGTVIGSDALLLPGRSYRGHLEGGRLHRGA